MALSGSGRGGRRGWSFRVRWGWLDRAFWGCLGGYGYGIAGYAFWKMGYECLICDSIVTSTAIVWRY